MLGLAAFSVQAQKISSNKDKLERLSRSYERNSERAREKAFEMARKKNWIIFKELPNGKIMSLQDVDEFGLPRYLITENNSTAANTTQANRLYAGGGLGLSLSGSSAFLTDKVGVWDGGSVFAEHQEFAGNRILNKNASAAVSRHSTHVAGTMVASGLVPIARGMAFGLPRLLAYDFNNDDAEMASEAGNNMLISNHSYGFIAGWYYNESPSGGGAARWEWYGNDGAFEDYKYGFYGSDARSWDEICYNAPYYLPVKSAGNDRYTSGPAVGETYYKYVSGSWTQATRAAGDISNQEGYDLIGLNGIAKNILTVGAVFGITGNLYNASTINIASFSGTGPADDGRIKPDVVGMGVALTSTVNTSSTAYAALNGTSMASPNVSGSLVLLQEAYAQKNNGAVMRSAALKGLAIHTAVDAGNAGPDYIYGWGLLNAEKAAKVIQEDGSKSRIIWDELSQGASKSFSVISSGNGPIVATICWTDPAGPNTSAGAIDDRSPRLVNDLDLRINEPSIVHRPWILDPDQPANLATRGDNTRDNVEQVLIDNPIPGKTYTINITHKGTLSNSKQAFALIVSGVGGTAYCPASISSNADSKITSFSLNNINYVAPSGCTTVTDNTGLLINAEAGGSYPLSLGLGSCGANADKIAKVYIDYNNNGSFNESTELVATSGVINASGTLNTTISIPTTVSIDNFSLVRIVLAETTNPASVTACGTYAKGEVMEFRIKFLRASKDVGVTAITDPANGNCANAAQKVSLKLKNYAIVSISNIPVKVNIYNGATLVATLSETFTGSISPLAEASFTLSTGFNAVAGNSYQLTAFTELSGDMDAANNSTALSVSISNPPAISNASVLNCSSSGDYTLNASGSGTIFWYTNAADQVPVAYSLNNAAASYKNTGPTIGTFYAGINDFSAKVGPASNTVFSGGGYLGGNNPAVLMNTKVPVILESAKLYIGAAGKITFVASSNATGLEASRVTLDVSPATQLYNLNLLLPAAGDYTVSISYEGGATIYRNNAGVSGYPFKIGDIFSITGNTASTTPESFYYYFYDLSVKSAGCVGSARTAVSTSLASTPLITRNGNVLSSNQSAGNQWYYNGTAISGATGQSYTANQAGAYYVKAGSGTCTQNSATVFVGVTFPLPYNNFTVKTTDASCTSSGNGKINLTASQALPYKVVLTKPDNSTSNLSFTNNLEINFLNSGNYKLCISVEGNPDYSICYDLFIGPKDLSVYTKVNPVTNSVNLNLNGGNSYQVELNGERYFTSSNSITLPLIVGENNIRVVADKECQGVYEESIFIDAHALIYPNPFSDKLKIRLGGRQSEVVEVSIINRSGLVVYQNSYPNSSGTIELNLSHLESGIYFLKTGNKTYKILKK